MNEDRREAIALVYEAADGAPRVVAKGSGLIAEEIIARAREAGVYVHESADLVSLLMNVNLDSRIPPQLYIAVAELLAWVYRLESGQPVGPPLASIPSGAGKKIEKNA
ncbi:MAG: EscU/YscU/HrcU family type III secretion system export apparatus switch protein [Betaproteobacteria bacterium]|nr:EscU/YscU/HrcU family type III secretion system export apparatus switch protein [Betaproteobacteria bacterium]